MRSVERCSSGKMFLEKGVAERDVDGYYNCECHM